MYSFRNIQTAVLVALLALLRAAGTCAQDAPTTPGETQLVEPQPPAIVMPGESGLGEPPIGRILDSPDSLPTYGGEELDGLPPNTFPPGLQDLIRQSQGSMPQGYPGGNLFQGGGEGAPLEEQEATVRKALADLESQDPEIRRSACMILGKYTLPMARTGLFKAIHDPVPMVRRTALVALLENRSQLLGREAMEVLPMVADEDVHNRRLASSALQGMSLSTPITVKNGRTPVRIFPPEVTAKLQAAFQDSDLTVRRNMVSGMANLRMDLDEAIVAKLLADSDREIRLGTLAALSQVQPDLLIKLGNMLVDDPEPLVKEELVNQLARVRTPSTRALLEKLAKDPSAKVSMLARLVLFEMDPSAKAYRELLPILDQPGVSSEILRPLIYSASLLPSDEGREIIGEILKKRNPMITADALTVYSSMISTMGKTDVSPVLPYLEDAVPAIRQSAFSVLMRAPEGVNKELLQKLMSSPHADVRQQTVYLARISGSGQADEIAMELLLDDNVEVRVAALRELVARQAPEWEVIAAQTLKDDNEQMAQAALETLGSQLTPETLKILETFAAENPQHPLREQVLHQIEFMRDQLQQLGRQRRMN